MTGAPGPRYWQQWSAYTIRARLDVEARRLEGTTRIVYHNRSPRPLPMVTLQLVQNHHREGAARNRPAQLTKGMEIARVAVNDEEVGSFDAGVPNGYRQMGTTMTVRLPRALQAGGSVTLEVAWGFNIPQHGAGGRMGWSKENFLGAAVGVPTLAAGVSRGTARPRT